MNLLLHLISLILLLFGLLCLATSQDAHAKHTQWQQRMAAVGLAHKPLRRWCGSVALCTSAALLGIAEGAAFGLVTWVMAAGLGSALLAWRLSPN
ncbi:MAG TPA: DUF3325 family protein [Limnobacter sp.]|nr:DUF3325 family protein [Limnobacter sp.]